MAGICGFTLKKTYHLRNEHTWSKSFSIQDMIDSIKLSPKLECKILLNKDTIGIGCVYLNDNYEVYENETGIVVVYGSIYNSDEILNKKSAKLISHIILENYCHSDNFSHFLNTLDGKFSCVIYDKYRLKIVLLTDFLGLNFLYWYKDTEKFIFSSEIKGILACKDLDLEFDDEAINCFIHLGYFPEDRTYFRKIKLLRNASFLEYDCNSTKVKINKYFKFSSLTQQDISYEEAIDSLHTLLLDSVYMRIKDIDQSNLGLSLSGGLDSRLCLALCNELGKLPLDIHTFGTYDCADVYIARLICNKFSLKHTFLDLESADIIKHRITGCWLTDGMLGIQHMQGCEFHNCTNCLYELNGYAGDAVLGCTFKNNPYILDKRINIESAYYIYRDLLNLFDIFTDDYDISHFEPHIYMNRVRRFTTMGQILGDNFHIYLLPFVSKRIIEFIFSIPDYFRFNNNLYSDLLLKYYGDFFSDIPWQHTKQLIHGKNYKNQNAIKKFSNSNLSKCLYRLQHRFYDYKAFLNTDIFIKFTKKYLPDGLLTINNKIVKLKKSTPLSETFNIITAAIYLDLLNSHIKNTGS